MYLFIELYKNHVNYSNTWFPNLFGTRDWLHGRHRPGVGGWVREDSNALHLLCALFLLLLHQLYLRSSGIRSWRLKTPFLMYTNILLWCLLLTKSCLTVCNSMVSSVPGFHVLHHLPLLLTLFWWVTLKTVYISCMLLEYVLWIGVYIFQAGSNDTVIPCYFTRSFLVSWALYYKDQAHFSCCLSYIQQFRAQFR